jgi:hypothetical protein
MRSLFNKLLQYRAIYIYFLFIAYLIYIHPDIIERLSQTSPKKPDPLLGWIFLLIPLLEILGIWLKYPVLAYYRNQYPAKESNWMVIAMVFLPILHIGMSAFLFIAGTQIAGLQPEGDAAWYWQLLYVAGFFLILFKEGGFLALFFTFGGMNWTKNQRYPPKVIFLNRLQHDLKEIRLVDIILDTLGDIFLLIFSALGYTALWEHVGMSSPFYTQVSWWEYLTQFLGVIIYFLMVIPPLQAVYMLQNATLQISKMQRFWFRVQFVLTLVVAYLSISKV